VEGTIRTGKDTGLGHLPSSAIEINRAWCLAATIACDLLCWLRLLCLDGPLATAEPKTLRYRIPHTAARIVHGQRKRKIRIPETWPWAQQLATCLLTALALPHRPNVDQPRPCPRPGKPSGTVESGAHRRRQPGSEPDRTLTTTSTSQQKINIRGLASHPAAPVNDQG
jgi:Transposase DDE domain group 1